MQFLNYLIEWITNNFIPHLSSNNNWDVCIGMKTRQLVNLHKKETQITLPVSMQQYFGQVISKGNSRKMIFYTEIVGNRILPARRAVLESTAYQKDGPTSDSFDFSTRIITDCKNQPLKCLPKFPTKYMTPVSWKSSFTWKFDFHSQFSVQI